MKKILWLASALCIPGVVFLSSVFISEVVGFGEVPGQPTGGREAS